MLVYKWLEGVGLLIYTYNKEDWQYQGRIVLSVPDGKVFELGCAGNTEKEIEQDAIAASRIINARYQHNRNLFD